MTPRQAAELTGIPHEVILDALRGGALPGKKYHKRWHIKPAKAWRFGRVNKRALNALAQKYVSLYWQGRSVDWLQAHTKANFEANHIIWPVAGFAERVIYESLKKPCNPCKSMEG